MNFLTPDPILKTKQIKSLRGNQKNVYDSLSFPRSLKTLYKLHKATYPESSVRRVIYSLRNEGLVEKTKNGKWVQTK